MCLHVFATYSRTRNVLATCLHVFATCLQWLATCSNVAPRVSKGTINSFPSSPLASPPAQAAASPATSAARQYVSAAIVASVVDAFVLPAAWPAQKLFVAPGADAPAPDSSADFAVLYPASRSERSAVVGISDPAPACRYSEPP